MKNTIILTIPFSFKGKEYKPSAEIDLDLFHQQGLNHQALAHTVATQNKIDNYSYEYEVLQASELHFSDAAGLAEKHLQGTTFDFEGFKKEYEESIILETLQSIAEMTLKNNLNNTLNNNLDENEALKNALTQAYYAGQNSVQT